LQARRYFFFIELNPSVFRLESFPLQIHVTMQAKQHFSEVGSKPSIHRLVSLQPPVHTFLQAGRHILSLGSKPLSTGWILSNFYSASTCKQVHTSCRSDQILLSTGWNLTNGDSEPACKQVGTSSVLGRNLCPQAAISSTVILHLPASRIVHPRCWIETRCPQTGIIPPMNRFFPASRDECQHGQLDPSLCASRNLSSNSSAPSCKQASTSPPGVRSLLHLQAGISLPSLPYLPASRVVLHWRRLDTPLYAVGLLCPLVQHYHASKVMRHRKKLKTVLYTGWNHAIIGSVSLCKQRDTSPQITRNLPCTVR
jgi:hypothetical protein